MKSSVLFKRLSWKELAVFFVFLIVIVRSSWTLGYYGIDFNIFKKSQASVADFQRVYKLVEEEFYGEFDREKILEHSIAELVASLGDEESYYMTAEEYRQRKSEPSSAMPNYKLEELGSGRWYLKINHFYPGIEQDFAEIERALLSAQVRELTIDLRDNLGGEIEVAAAFADQFLSEGVLYRERRAHVKDEIIHNADGIAPFAPIQLDLLVNERTASAAELFVMALKFNGRAEVHGDKTYGKSTEQLVFELRDGSAISLTVGQWFGPKGELIEGVGIEP